MSQTFRPDWYASFSRKPERLLVKAALRQSTICIEWMKARGKTLGFESLMSRRFHLDWHEFGSRKPEQLLVKAGLRQGVIYIEWMKTRGKTLTFESLSPRDQYEILDWLSDQMKGIK